MSKCLGNFLSDLTPKLVLALALALLLTPLAQAQLYRGAITGTAVDPTDAAVAEVQVIVTNQETGVTITTTTNDKGVYRVPVDAGTYSVDFTKMGFQTYKFGTVEVTSSKDTTVNANLTVGAVSSQVHVTAEAIELDKSSATVRLTLPRRILDEIPLGTSSLVPAGSRNFARYALFTPGVARVLFQNETSALGHRGRENNYMLDGTDNNDQSVTLPALFTPPEAIREVDVQAATFSAEYGRNIGAQINVITRSGTNRYAGEVWEFYRGNALEPLSLSSRIAGQTRPPRLVDNQFGGTFGGPVIKNKTFVFGLLQGNLLRTGPRPQSAVTIPTPTGYAALQTVALRSTPTAQSAASRQAMLDAINFLPGAHATIANYDTTSTATVNGTAIQMGSFRPVIPSRQNIWYGLMRLDHELTGTDRLTYRGHVDRRISPLSTGYLAFDGRWGVDTKYFGQNHFLGYTKTLGSSFVNESRVTYTRLFPSFEERDKVSPTINITNAFQIGGSANFPQERLEQTYQFQNVSTYSLNRHSLRFGLDISRTKLINNSATNARGTWNFTSLENFMNSTPSSLSYLLSAPLRFSFHQVRQAYFIQDDFKVTRNLTANFGLRYETSSVPLGFLGATTTEVLNALGQPPTKRDKNNWGPRVGFAYSPESDSGILGKLLGDGKSSIRGGFGIGYDVLFYSLIASGPANNYPRQDSQSFAGASTVDIFPTLPPKSTSPTLTISSVLINIPPDAQNPTSHYWSLSLQRKLLSDYVLELGYNGNRSYHLIRQSQFNPGVLSAAKAAAVIAGCTSANLGTCQDPAGFPRSPGAPTTTDSGRMVSTQGNRTLLETTGRNAYHGMYVQFTGRTGFGLRFGANYTWSATLSDSEEFSNDAGTRGSSDGGIAGSTPQVPQDYFNKNNDWSRSVFDRPHRMTVHYNYEIPWFRNTGSILNQVFKGWQWSGFTEMQSGQPFTIRTGVDAFGNGATAGSRPNYNPNGIITLDPVTGNFRTFVTPLNGTGIVSAPFVQNPTTGTITFLRNSMPSGGNLGRNTFRGPGYVNFNMSLAKRFTLPGERQLTLRGDFINVFNHDNFPNPQHNMSDPDFGKQYWLPLTDARQVLIGAKLAF